MNRLLQRTAVAGVGCPLREVERFPESYWRHLEFNLGRCEDYWQRQPDAARGAARPNLTQADPVPASQPCGRGAESEDDADGPTRGPRVPLDRGTIEEAS